MNKGFSHYFADFAHRLPLAPRADVRGLLFAASPDWSPRTPNALPGFVEQALQYLGIDGVRVHVTQEPVVVESLIVTGQGSQVGRPPIDAYALALSGVQQRELPYALTGDPVFLSRAGLARGRLLGEGYLEQVLAESGVTVVRPETQPLADVYRAVAESPHVLLSEGRCARPGASGLHTG